MGPIAAKALNQLLEMDQSWSGPITLRLALRALPITLVKREWTAETQVNFADLFRMVQLEWAAARIKRRGKKWSQEDDIYLEELWQQGETASHIAKILGVSRELVIGKASVSRLHARPNSPIIRPNNPWTASKAYQPGDSLFASDSAIQCLLVAVGYSPSNRQPNFVTNNRAIVALELLMASVESSSNSDSRFDGESMAAEVLRDLSYMGSELSADSIIELPLYGVPTPNWMSLTSFRKQESMETIVEWYNSRTYGHSFRYLKNDFEREFDRRIAMIKRDVWASGINQIAGEIESIYRDIQPLNENFSLLSGGLAKLDKVESQTSAAVHFELVGDKIDLDRRDATDGLLNNEEAKDRHQELLDCARDVVELYERFSIGSNQVGPLVQLSERLIDALGDGPTSVRPGLLIPRGERLRQKLSVQRDSQAVSISGPLPAEYLEALEVLVSAFNIYVALDPKLARYDEARSDPSLQFVAISRQDADIITKSAFKDNIISSEAAEVVFENIETVSHSDVGQDRSDRRLGETVRNLIRVVMSYAVVPVKTFWKNRQQISGAFKVGLKFGEWITRNEANLIAAFPPNSAMVHLIQLVASAVRKWNS